MGKMTRCINKEQLRSRAKWRNSAFSNIGRTSSSIKVLIRINTLKVLIKT